MIDFDLVKLMHRHGDGWASLERIESHGPEGAHGSPAHDPERSPTAWAQVYRCSTCAEEFALGTGDPAQTEPGSDG